MHALHSENSYNFEQGVNHMTQEELKAYLPHRDNMLLVEEAVILQDENGTPYAYGRTVIHGNEWFLQGHFPNDPVVPGVILCEIMAQSLAVLLPKTNSTPYFTGMNQVKWRHPVRPGDIFETECRLIRSKGQFYWAKAVGRVNDTLCVSAEFSIALVR